MTIATGTTVKVTDNTALDLKGTIANSGTIALNSSGDTTQLKISGSVLLNGSGHVTLTDNTHNSIVSDGSAATLSNSNTITGAGTIGDTLLTLVNNGTIDATGTNALTIDTGINTATERRTRRKPYGHEQCRRLSWRPQPATPCRSMTMSSTTGSSKPAGNTGSSSVAVVDITGNITGTGSIEIFNNAKLEIGGSVSSGQTVTFEVSNGACRADPR